MIRTCPKCGSVLHFPTKVCHNCKAYIGEDDEPSEEKVISESNVPD